MKKVVHLITSLEGGGTENFLCQILAHSPEGYDHQVFFLKKDGVIGDRIRHQNIPIRRVTPWQLYQALQKEKPHLLHTCLYSAHQLGRVLGRLAGVPAIITSQRSIDIWQKPWQTLLDTQTLPLSQAVIANSRAAAQVIEHRRGQKKKPEIFEIPNSIDLTQFKIGNREAARQRYNLPADAIVGGSLMRLHEEKGADFIPEFASRLLPGHANLHLLIGGVGALENSIKEGLAGTAYKDRIHWTGWENDTPAFLSACDFFWSLSREESFPQTLVEASAMGRPWVAPDTGGVPELLAGGGIGRVFKRLDIPDAAVKVSQTLINLPALTQEAMKVIPDLQGRYALTSMVNRVYDVFERFGNPSHS